MSLESALDIFFEEAADLLRDFEEGLLRLEQAPSDAEVLNRVFRAAHTLKGNSGMLGFEAIARFTHVLENLLMRVRGGELDASRSVINTLLASADVLRALVQRAKDSDGDAVPNFQETLEALQAFGRAETPVQPVAPAARQASGARTVYEIRFNPPEDLLRRGLDPVRILDSLDDLGTVARLEPDLSCMPALGAMDPESAYLGFTCWLETGAPRERIEACFEFVGDPIAVTIEARPGAGADRPGEGPVEAFVERRSGLDRRGGADDSSRTLEVATIRVPTEKVDRLIDLVGELVITQSMVAQLVAQFTPERLDQLAEAVAQMDRHARDLQERVMAVRMLPIGRVFSRFPRVVRDLAQAQGKQVVLETVGEETELDKSVIEQISDPLTHLVRNAVDHGIEPPRVRRAAGKPEVGRLALKAYQQGGNIYIEIADDGSGLNRERILRKAIELGLVAPDESLTDDQVSGLIFRPGFSTAEQITEVSGRGVGLDVVKRNLEGLGGSVTIHTEEGRGTTFKVKLPLTLAILDGQSVRVGDETYIIPLVSIIESVRPRRGELSTVFGIGEGITIRGQVLPVLRLHRLFQVTPRSEDPTQGLVVIVEQDGRKVALLVDELLGQQQVVIKSLEANFQKLDGLAGATILGDGRVALILDVSGLVAMTRTADRRAA